ncbi:hypothetical protein BZL30_5025 [Mycobacterium kansasii]|uniref:Uncharacterized protein n=1 Tax=Mycobacterium kansasii TaxID=1768 RepID=A0A1V3X3M7_MYCKA|nr:hypothetical protein BZL30_5025 [Mycobacterium kansasii]
MESMVRRLALRAFAVSATVAALACELAPAAYAEPPLVFPGMEIHQDIHICTLAYVDAKLRMAFSAGHCRGEGAVSDRDNNVIGHLRAFRDNTQAVRLWPPTSRSTTMRRLHWSTASG